MNALWKTDPGFRLKEFVGWGSLAVVDLTPAGTHTLCVLSLVQCRAKHMVRNTPVCLDSVTGTLWNIHMLFDAARIVQRRSA